MKTFTLIFLVFSMTAIGQTLPDSYQSTITNNLNYKKTWTPTKIQTDSAFQEVLYFLKTKGYKYNDTINWNYNIYRYDSTSDYEIQQIPMIYNLLKSNKYCIQFIGNFNEKKEKCIIINFFSVKTDTSTFYNNCNCSAQYGLRIQDKSKETLYSVIDGGYYYWRITFKYARKKCYNFWVNTIG